MSKKSASLFTGFLYLTLASVALATIEVPEVDPLVALLELIQNWKALSPLAIGAALIVVLVQGVKKYAPGFKHLRALVVVGGVLYGLVSALASGIDLVNALVLVLVTSGGAVALYELFKNPLNTVFGVKK